MIIRDKIRPKKLARFVARLSLFRLWMMKSRETAQKQNMAENWPLKQAY